MIVSYKKGDDQQRSGPAAISEALKSGQILTSKRSQRYDLY